eukprot:365329-Chlamydomonas_euryale.AAC.10
MVMGGRGFCLGGEGGAMCPSGRHRHLGVAQTQNDKAGNPTSSKFRPVPSRPVPPPAFSLPQPAGPASFSPSPPPFRSLVTTLVVRRTEVASLREHGLGERDAAHGRPRRRLGVGHLSLIRQRRVRCTGRRACEAEATARLRAQLRRRRRGVAQPQRVAREQALHGAATTTPPSGWSRRGGGRGGRLPGGPAVRARRSWMPPACAPGSAGKQPAAAPSRRTGQQLIRSARAQEGGAPAGAGSGRWAREDRRALEPGCGNILASAHARVRNGLLRRMHSGTACHCHSLRQGPPCLAAPRGSMQHDSRMPRRYRRRRPRTTSARGVGSPRRNGGVAPGVREVLRRRAQRLAMFSSCGAWP